MKSIILNLDQILPSRIEKNSKGERIVKLMLAKLKKAVPGGATHILYHKPTREDVQAKRYIKKDLVGCSISKAEHVPNPNKFYMVFLEGGQTPTVEYSSYDEAFTEAEHLSARFDKKAWVLESISAVTKAEPKELTEEEKKGDLAVEVPVKKQRVRKPVTTGKRPEKVEYRK